MSAHYTVSATPDAREAGAVTQTVASLPATFGPAPAGHPGTADVLVIAGGPGWTAEACSAVSAGARGIVVANPVPEDTTELAAAADAAGTAVVLDLRWASNPALVGETPDAREAVRSALGTASLLDSVATAGPGTDPRRLLGEHLAALLAVTGALDGVGVLRSDATGYTVSGRLANGAPFTAQGVLTAARRSGVDIRLYTADGGVAIQVPDPDAAWPAEVRVTGTHGELFLPTLYESAHRSAWRRLKDHLSAGTRPDDLAGFARLTDLYATLAAT
ncbi:hypothetical protein ACFFGR_15750 [Arthrobacter liuii]|uniref:Uncharacterized protein n=1 Tax=Arthrobacter liuii TaxID=1476996 RepID=A0ABQ2AQY4_9MICC|nr:hypothetical protein [Arthrobacter liuii]GGH95746.1 hypothetical protein GCM10007170_21990 [Arthrobacter liuii]